MQKILEAADHDGRIELMQYFVDAERKRLSAKKMLKSMFGGDASVIASEEEESSREAAAATIESSSTPPPSSIPKVEPEESKSQLSADDDAFQ